MTAPRRSIPAETPNETGETVADARRLARKAVTIAVFYRTGPRDWDKECLFLDTTAFLKAIANKKDDAPMPCRFEADKFILLIGVL